MSQWDLSQPYLYFNREGTDNRLWWHSYPPNMCTRMLSGLTIIASPLNCPEFCIRNPCFAPLLNWQCPTLRAEDLSRASYLCVWGEIPTFSLSLLLQQLRALLAGWFRHVSHHLPKKTMAWHSPEYHWWGPLGVLIQPALLRLHLLALLSFLHGRKSIKG